MRGLLGHAWPWDRARSWSAGPRATHAGARPRLKPGPRPPSRHPPAAQESPGGYLAARSAEWVHNNHRENMWPRSVGHRAPPLHRQLDHGGRAARLVLLGHRGRGRDASRVAPPRGSGDRTCGRHVWWGRGRRPAGGPVDHVEAERDVGRCVRSAARDAVERCRSCHPGGCDPRDHPRLVRGRPPAVDRLGAARDPPNPPGRARPLPRRAIFALWLGSQDHHLGPWADHRWTGRRPGRQRPDRRRPDRRRPDRRRPDRRRPDRRRPDRRRPDDPWR